MGVGLRRERERETKRMRCQGERIENEREVFLSMRLTCFVGWVNLENERLCVCVFLSACLFVQEN